MRRDNRTLAAQPATRPAGMVEWLDRDALAAYLSVRVERIARLLKEGKLPQPSYHLGPKQPRYERAAVDAMMRGGPGNAPPTDTATPEQLGDAIARELARRRAKRRGTA